MPLGVGWMLPLAKKPRQSLGAQCLSTSYLSPSRHTESHSSPSGALSLTVDTLQGWEFTFMAIQPL